MFRQHFTGLVLGLTLLASLVTGTVVSGAQTAPDLSHAYTWSLYDVSVRYPANWEVILTGQTVSVRPTGLDVSDGLGPELILFTASSASIDSAVRTLADSMGGTTSSVTVDWLAGRERRAFSYESTLGSARGGITLLAANGDVIGAAFIVRHSDESQYLPLLEAMLASVSFGSAAGGLSASTASVQLPQPYAWNDAGLMLHFPAGWTVEVERDLDGELLVATPDDLPGSPFRVIQAAMLDEPGTPLYAAAMAIARDLGAITATANTTVAGHSALVFDVRDDSEAPTFYVRSVMVDIPKQRGIGVLFLGADESYWPAFHPIASAFISSIEPLGQAPVGGLQRIAAAPDDGGGPARQDGPSGTQTVDWEEFGVTLTAPEGWTVQPGNGEDFDLALISPEAYEVNTGSFLTFRVVPSLGADTTLESALQPIAENAEVDVEPITIGDLEAYQVTLTDEEAGTVHHLVLMPYGSSGGVLYVQTTATPDADEQVQAILQSMVVAPPVPEYAAIDAAWEQSLAESGTLVYGPEDAPVKMIEYLSFTCSHCAVYSQDMNRLIALDVETGRVQLQIAALAGDALAQRATVATYCAAEQGVGYSAYKALFDAYLSSGPEVAYSEATVRELVEPLGVDMEQFDACLAGDAYAPLLDEVRASFQNFGLTGTPTVLLATNWEDLVVLEFPDGTPWSGRIPLSALRTIIRSIADDNMLVSEAVEKFFAG